MNRICPATTRLRSGHPLLRIVLPIALTIAAAGCSPSPPEPAAVGAATPAPVAKFDVMEATIADIQAAIKGKRSRRPARRALPRAHQGVQRHLRRTSPRACSDRIETIPHAGQINALPR